ncbi:MMPL family transporter [Denitromonas ohlonensis]|uniref:MMPL family transporter n=2 Tax=Denitromonas TaxID=139331 RepID=A0A557RG27_9RHOO|nr:MMPL family transporter [Denitromonas ohlonensis]TVO64094.1 MMPL family transporter [Denitromonas ohlonensis]TVO75995.1 MMPL family transporter [Denitromonas ohlonensis]TVT77381.1 MAG: MMPL family transporter [Denitromonas halophila]
MPRRLFTFLAAALVAGMIALAAFDKLPVETDLLAMLPATERSPIAEQAMSQLARAHERRIVLLTVADDAAQARAGAQVLATTLRASPALQHVTLDIPPDALDTLLTTYLPHRFGLLSAATRAALQQRGRDALQEDLYRALASPIPTATPVPRPLDPFGTLAGFLADLPFAGGAFAPEDGILMAHRDGHSYALVSAETVGSPHAVSTQDAVVAALAQARAAVQAQVPAAHFEATGLVLYAEAAQTTAKREMSLIGGISLLGITALLLLAFRSLRPVLLGIACIATGVAAGIAVVLLVDGQLHLLTLVCGTSLLGIAVDYPLHYFAKRRLAGADWHAGEAMAAMRPALTQGLLTSLLGYSALLAMPFPGLRQIALFSMVGLGTAYLATLMMLPLFAHRADPRSTAGLDRLRQAFATWQRFLQARAHWLLPMAVAACLPGAWMLTHNDDVRLLSTPDPALARQEAQIRELTQLGQGSRLFLVHARNTEQLLQREEQLTDALRARDPQHAGGFTAISSFVPSAQRQTDHRRLIGEALFGDDQWAAHQLDEVGYRPRIAEALSQAYQTELNLTLDVWLKQPLSTPYRHLWLGPAETGVASVITLHGSWTADTLAAASADLPGVTLLDKPAAVSKLMAQYRRGMAWALACAIGLSLILLSRRHGWRGAAATLIPCVLAVGVPLAALGYLGLPATLFHWLALMLVFGIGADYGIFTREGGPQGEAALGVLLAAITTVLGFGLLAFSSTPAIASFGLTLFMGVITAFLASPLALAGRSAHRSTA